jgi:hypothetical protein
MSDKIRFGVSFHKTVYNVLKTLYPNNYLSGIIEEAVIEKYFDYFHFNQANVLEKQVEKIVPKINVKNEDIEAEIDKLLNAQG